MRTSTGRFSSGTPYFPLVLVLLAFTGVSGSAQSASRITAPIDAAARVTIADSVHPLAQAAYDQGAVEPQLAMQRMLLVLGASPEQEQELRTLLDAQQTPGSPEYRRWLTPAEFGARFGPSSEDVQKVKGWLEAQGFEVGGVARSGRWMEFSGTAEQVTQAFQTPMRRYQVGGRIHLANAAAISIPAALSPVVRGVASLHDFFSKPSLTRYYPVQRNASGVLAPVDPSFSYPPGPAHYLAPADFATIYDVTPLYQEQINGSGQAIAIVGRSRVESTDVQIFRQIFGLPAAEPQMIVSGEDPGFTGDDDSVEASLDVEWAGAVAPEANLELVVSSSTNTTDGVDLAAAYAVDNNLAGIVSVSFGNCEPATGSTENLFWSSLWQQAAAQGISVFVAAGDAGAAGCDSLYSSEPASGGLGVNALASTANDTAVGGTEFQENGNDAAFWNAANDPAFGSAFGYVPEAVWNENCDPTISGEWCFEYYLTAGAGGVSILYAKPSWQVGWNVPNDTSRDLPDVSLAAAALHDGYLFCFEGSCGTTTDSQGNPVLVNAEVVGGTSAGAPAFAGLLALIDQKTGSRQGLANYMLYPLAASENLNACDASAQTDPAVRAPCIFHDITSGNNSVPGQTGYSAGSGFDLTSGLGSVDAANLASAWASAASEFQGSTTTMSAAVGGAPASAISFQHGGAVMLGIQVEAISGRGTPAGNVALLSDKYGAVASGVLVNGRFSNTFTLLPGGTYNLSAHYPGGGVFGGSDSSAIPVNITPENSVVQLLYSFGGFSGSGSTAAVMVAYGFSFVLQATVTAVSGNGIATGSLTFMDGGSVLAVVPLDSSGNASYTFGSGNNAYPALGSHTITAYYSGDNSLNPSVSAQPLPVMVTQGNLGWGFGIGQVEPGEWRLLAEALPTSAPLPTGTVQFFDGNTALGPPEQFGATYPYGVPWVSTLMPLSPGVHNLSFNYSGDATYAAFSFPGIPFTVPALFALSASNAVASIAAGQTATYNLMLTPNDYPGGTVTLTCAGAPAGATCTVTPKSIQLADTAVPITVTVSTATGGARSNPRPLQPLALTFAGAFAFLAGCVKMRSKFAAAFLVLLLVAGMSGCGGGGPAASSSSGSGSGGGSNSTGNTTAPQSVALVITASDGTNTSNIVLALEVQ
jgi:hypothetical protein